MRPEDVHTPEDFGQWLAEKRAELEEAYRTPRWERVLLVVVLVMLILVVVSAIASMIVPAVRS